MDSYDKTATLESILTQSWIDLAHGALSAGHAYHTSALASSGDGSPDVRTVVLREARFARRELVCHTDYRSPKVELIRKRPEVAWLFYDRASRVQLRLKGTVSICHDDDIARVHWEQSARHSRQLYRSARSPGSVSPGPGFTPWIEGGFANFAVLVCTVSELDWLYLREGGHMRARFDWRGESWQGAWLTP